MPRAPEIRRVDDALSIGRPVGMRLPVRLLVTNFTHLRTRLGAHAPDAAGAVRAPAIRDDEQLASVGGPRWREIVIPLRVVVAAQLWGLVVLGDAGGVNEPSVAHARDEDVPSPVERRRHPREP